MKSYAQIVLHLKVSQARKTSFLLPGRHWTADRNFPLSYKPFRTYKPSVVEFPIKQISQFWYPWPPEQHNLWVKALTMCKMWLYSCAQLWAAPGLTGSANECIEIRLTYYRGLRLFNPITNLTSCFGTMYDWKSIPIVTWTNGAQ